MVVCTLWHAVRVRGFHEVHNDTVDPLVRGPLAVRYKNERRARKYHPILWFGLDKMATGASPKRALKPRWGGGGGVGVKSFTEHEVFLWGSGSKPSVFYRIVSTLRQTSGTPGIGNVDYTTIDRTMCVSPTLPRTV